MVHPAVTVHECRDRYCMHVNLWFYLCAKDSCVTPWQNRPVKTGKYLMCRQTKHIARVTRSYIVNHNRRTVIITRYHITLTSRRHCNISLKNNYISLCRINKFRFIVLEQWKHVARTESETCHDKEYFIMRWRKWFSTKKLLRKILRDYLLHCYDYR